MDVEYPFVSSVQDGLFFVLYVCTYVCFSCLNIYNLVCSAFINNSWYLHQKKKKKKAHHHYHNDDDVNDDAKDTAENAYTHKYIQTHTYVH